ncbi:hypothetical protein JEQ12_018544 [Ovis aries]|uniref:Uncharacterized protein n=1 Tax=Ovis aries TaxID=9940 RepID=A0A836A6D0_SHEEP|nr:hypothetical protein JEQ12_018544 [Ovis aries]
MGSFRARISQLQDASSALARGDVGPRKSVLFPCGALRRPAQPHSRACDQGPGNAKAPTANDLPSSPQHALWTAFLDQSLKPLDTLCFCAIHPVSRMQQETDMRRISQRLRISRKQQRSKKGGEGDKGSAHFENKLQLSTSGKRVKRDRPTEAEFTSPGPAICWFWRSPSRLHGSPPHPGPKGLGSPLRAVTFSQRVASKASVGEVGPHMVEDTTLVKDE